jgi:hypothetical protein
MAALSAIRITVNILFQDLRLTSQLGLCMGPISTFSEKSANGKRVQPNGSLIFATEKIHGEHQD